MARNMSPEDVSKTMDTFWGWLQFFMCFMTNWQSFCKETQDPHHPKSLVVQPFPEVSYFAIILLHRDVFLTRSVGVNNFFFFFKHDQIRTNLLSFA